SVYPVLVSEVDVDAPSSDTGPSQSSLTRTVEAALRSKLAWRPRSDDPEAFLAALKNSFTIAPYEGRTVVRWTPRSYAATIGADLGAVTGAQASLVSRAKVEIEAALPLLGGLTPLRTNSSSSYVAASRAVVEQSLNELLAELGNPDAPRIPKVDDLLK